MSFFEEPIPIDEVGVYLTFLQLSSNLCLYLEGEYSVRRLTNFYDSCSFADKNLRLIFVSEQQITNELAEMMTNHYQTIYFKPGNTFVPR